MESMEVDDLVGDNAFLFDRIDGGDNDFSTLEESLDALLYSASSAICSGDDISVDKEQHPHHHQHPHPPAPHYQHPHQEQQQQQQQNQQQQNQQQPRVVVGGGMAATTTTVISPNEVDVRTSSNDMNLNGNGNRNSHGDVNYRWSGNRALEPMASYEMNNMNMNAVHMEVQENAKIPNLYNMPQRRQPRSEAVAGDRSRNASIDINSGGIGNGPGGPGLLDEIMRLDEVDWNLTEKFLMSENRTSAAAAYSNSGALLSSIGTKVDSLTQNEDERESSSDEMAPNGNGNGNIETNGNKKHVATKGAASSNSNNINSNITGAASYTPAAQSQSRSKSSPSKSRSPQNHLRSNYSYGRPIPLPIPSPLNPKKSNTNSTKTIERNTKTQTAAMVTTTKTTYTSQSRGDAPQQPPPSPTKPPYYPQYYSYSQPPPTSHTDNATTASPPSTKNSNNNGTTARQPTPIKNHHAPAAPTPFLLDATRKRSQFGFGNNHTVPSVPPSPMKKIFHQSPPSPINITNTKPHYTVKMTKKVKMTTTKAKTTKTAGTSVDPSTSITPIANTNTNTKIGAIKPTLKSKKKQNTPPCESESPPPPPTNNDLLLPHQPTPSSSSSIAAAAAAAAIAGPSPTTNEGPSYERKKQRAKDARVKLNESIERLSISMNVAGNQSKQRAHLHSYWAQRSSGLGGGGGGAKGGNHTMVKLMEDVGKAADLAKKWDRPSFVGTAATLVQGLNAQCEALMREVVELRKERTTLFQKKKDGKDVGRNGAGIDISSVCCQCESRKRPKEECEVDIEDDNGSSNLISSDSSSFDEIDRGAVRTVGGCGGLIPFSNHSKRRKIEDALDVNSPVSMMRLLRHGRVMHFIVACLDPLSITQCISVSRSWHHQIHYFTDSKIWLNLCARRFGTFNVREWQNHFSQDESCHDNRQLENGEMGMGKMNMMQLYRQMNTNNVKPRCHFEGNLNLGKGKIDNAVSAWVSAVERSNGETLRTVQSTHGGIMKYASIPVVELRILIQNIGVANGTLFLPEQIVSVDASTKRRGEEMFEISSDDRFVKRLLRLDGSVAPFLSSQRQGNHHHGVGALFKLELFEEAILCLHIHARSCQTTTKFRQKANFVKLLVNIHGTTLPLIIPITS